MFYDTFTDTLDCHVPLKKKKIRSNQNKFMTEKLRKKVMTRSPLRNKYNKDRTYENWSNYKKQCNICTNILKKRKTDYFNNVHIKNITDKQRFWTAVLSVGGRSIIGKKITADLNIFSDFPKTAFIVPNHSGVFETVSHLDFKSRSSRMY